VRLDTFDVSNLHALSSRAHKDVLTSMQWDLSGTRVQFAAGGVHFLHSKKLDTLRSRAFRCREKASLSALVVCSAAEGFQNVKKTSCLIIFVYGTLFCGNYTKSAVFEVDKKVGNYYFSSVAAAKNFHKCMQRGPVILLTLDAKTKSTLRNIVCGGDGGRRAAGCIVTPAHACIFHQRHGRWLFLFFVARRHYANPFFDHYGYQHEPWEAHAKWNTLGTCVHPCCTRTLINLSICRLLAIFVFSRIAFATQHIRTDEG
jgi:hypothetical protein